MEDNEKITMGGKVFAPMMEDMHKVMQRLLKNMDEKGIDEGAVNIKIDVSFVKVEVEGRVVCKPHFPYKVTSTLPIKDEIKGRSNSDNGELVYDEETGEYILRPIRGTAEQPDIFTCGGVYEPQGGASDPAIGTVVLDALPESATDEEDCAADL